MFTGGHAGYAPKKAYPPDRWLDPSSTAPPFEINAPALQSKHPWRGSGSGKIPTNGAPGQPTTMARVEDVEGLRMRQCDDIGQLE